MLNVYFIPESDKPELVKATNEYQKIWNSEGEKIVEAVEEISDLRFVKKTIKATVFEGVSFSHPLKLRASYPVDIKRGTLIHELCHRLLVDNKIEVGSNIKDNEARSLEIHKQIYLILYDIWTRLYGEEFAQKNVEVESARKILYKEAFDFVLSLTREEKADLFLKLKSKNKSV